MPYDLDGRSEVAYAREGVVARFVLPAKHLSLAEQPSHAVPGHGHIAGEEPAKAALPADLKVMLVEDQMLIALDAEGMLGDHGVLNVMTFASAADALSRLVDYTPDVAILDVNLGAGTSLSVARELMARKIPLPVCHRLRKQRNDSA